MTLIPLEVFAESSRRMKLAFSVERIPGGLEFYFFLAGALPGDLAAVVLPSLHESDQRKRRDEIWKSTCLEVFFSPADSREYIEFNLGPSGDWNLYVFDSYRSGQRQALGIRVPEIHVEDSPQGDSRKWRVRLQLDPADLARSESSADSLALQHALRGHSITLSATAVLEYNDGTKEYWATHHAGDKPDFHLRESFRILL